MFCCDLLLWRDRHDSIRSFGLKVTRDKSESRLGGRNSVVTKSVLLALHLGHGLKRQPS